MSRTYAGKKEIPAKLWQDAYIKRLRTVNKAAADDMLDYIHKNFGLIAGEDWKQLIDYAYSVATVYGEAAGAIACEFYDAIAAASSARVPAAVSAPTATYQEVTTAVLGTAKTRNANLVANSVSRLVKMSGVDTTMQNALRDGAEWAWIPSGDTCAFCLTLASRGWQRASKKAIRKGHAAHIHANCDCTYAVRFDSEMSVEGYDPKAIEDLYYSGGGNPTDRINNLRRALYAENRDEIRAQQRAAYADRKDRIAFYSSKK